MLGLQAQPVAVTIDRAPLALQRALEKIPRVELHAWLGRRDLEGAAALRLDHTRGKARFVALSSEHEVVVVADAELELRVRVVDAGPDSRRLPEVQRCAGNR